MCRGVHQEKTHSQVAIGCDLEDLAVVVAAAVAMADSSGDS